MLDEIFGAKKPVIGMVHLPPLPGSPAYKRGAALQSIFKRAIEDAKALAEGGIDGIQIENIGDRPFRKGVGYETVALVTEVVHRIKEEIDLPHGICLLMSGRASLAVAKATGGKWIRSTYHMEVYASYIGLMEGEAAELLRYRQHIDAEDIKIFADVHIKHAYPLLVRSTELSAIETAEMGLADAVIVSGSRTGMPADLEEVKRTKEQMGKIGCPLLLGSGARLENIEHFWPFIDGVIVGTGLKKGGKTFEAVDPEKVREFMRKVAELRAEGV